MGHGSQMIVLPISKLPKHPSSTLPCMQEPVLFAESIFYNIAFGLRRGEEDATLAQVRAFLLVRFGNMRLMNPDWTLHPVLHCVMAHMNL